MPIWFERRQQNRRLVNWLQNEEKLNGGSFLGEVRGTDQDLQYGRRSPPHKGKCSVAQEIVEGMSNIEFLFQTSNKECYMSPWFNDLLRCEWVGVIANQESRGLRWDNEIVQRGSDLVIDMNQFLFPQIDQRKENPERG